MKKGMIVTRNQIKVCAKFFPSLYELVEYDHGFEVISHGKESVRSVFFFNNGKACRTDEGGEYRPHVGIVEGARVLGMLGG